MKFITQIYYSADRNRRRRKNEAGQAASCLSYCCLIHLFQKLNGLSDEKLDEVLKTVTQIIHVALM